MNGSGIFQSDLDQRCGSRSSYRWKLQGDRLRVDIVPTLRNVCEKISLNSESSWVVPLAGGRETIRNRLLTNLSIRILEHRNSGFSLRNLCARLSKHVESCYLKSTDKPLQV